MWRSSPRRPGPAPAGHLRPNGGVPTSQPEAPRARRRPLHVHRLVQPASYRLSKLGRGPLPSAQMEKVSRGPTRHPKGRLPASGDGFRHPSGCSAVREAVGSPQAAGAPTLCAPVGGHATTTGCMEPMPVARPRRRVSSPGWLDSAREACGERRSATPDMGRSISGAIRPPMGAWVPTVGLPMPVAGPGPALHCLSGFPPRVRFVPNASRQLATSGGPLPEPLGGHGPRGAPRGCPRHPTCRFPVPANGSFRRIGGASAGNRPSTAGNLSVARPMSGQRGRRCTGRPRAVSIRMVVALRQSRGSRARAAGRAADGERPLCGCAGGGR